MNSALVSSINPESGHHGVTTDPHEIQATVKALANPSHMWVYLLWRFGERGVRFTNSDALWLAQVGHQDLDEVKQDLNWLRNVLATRGMPHVIISRYILDYNLAMESLRGADCRSARKLAVEIGLWESQKTAFISSDLGASWKRNIEPHLSVLPNSLREEFSEILLAGYIDQSNSFGKAYNSAAKWIGDNVVFNSEWTNAVLALGPQESEPL
jgi:hypothetical protein